MRYPDVLFLIPLCVVFIGLHVTYKYGVDWSTVTFQVSSSIMAVLVFAYWVTCNLWYQAWWLKSDKPKEQVEPEQPKRTLLDMNKADGFALTTQAVKIDARRNFAITLIRMLDYNGHDANKLDLTEDFWLGGWVDSKDHSKGKHPKRWKGKNKEFRDCMHDWDGAVFQKSDPTRSNSRYTLRDEMELKRKADGR